MIPNVTPYYERDGIAVYCGDCRELLPLIPKDSIDLVLTDPPYGVGHKTDYKSSGRSTMRPKDYPPCVGDEGPFDPAPLLRFGRCVLWGANYYANQLPEVSGWLLWDKRVRQDKGVNMDQAEGEMAWSNCVKGLRIFRHMWTGCWRDSEGRTGYHPMQKPVALMSWVLAKARPAGLVLDPYMGCGPVPLACQRIGVHCLAIEISEHYCEIAAKRLEAAEQGITVKELDAGQQTLFEASSV